MDSYIMIGTVFAVMASTMLFLRSPKQQDAKMKDDILKLGEQMKMYKKTAAAAAEAQAKEDGDGAGKTNSQFPGGRVTILFGSQTGTAEGFAEVLKKEGRKHGFETRTMDLEEFDAEDQLPSERCVIFVMATYGEGDPTDNAVAFTKLLKGKTGSLASDSFQGVGYTVFGLGNRQYEHYNSMGRLVDEKMAAFGAHRVYHYGEGDDDGTMDEDFDNWKESLWRSLRKQFVPGAADQDDETAKHAHSELHGPDLEYEITPVKAPAGAVDGVAPQPGNVRMKPSTKYFFTAVNAKVVVNREVRPSTKSGSTMHLEFDLKDTGVEYLTADNLAILPDNSTSNVERLAARLGYDLDQWVALEPLSGRELPFPSPCTTEKILSSFLSINSAPRKGPLKQLAYFARDETEQEKLLWLASKDGKDEYQKWILDDERTYVDVLTHFKSVQIPLAALVQLVPFMQPRYYTISSSSLVNPQRVHATVSIISNPKSDGRVFEGVCTNHLATLQPLASANETKKKRESRPGEQGTKQPREWPSARVFVRPSTFRLPADPLTPIILIGPGTGIAPMRAFLHERDYQKNTQGKAVGESLLFFGCRTRDDDFIYKDELEAFQQTGVLTELHLAFSREQSQKVYVQHLLAQQGARVYDLIAKQGAYIYVCGATTMGNDVHKVLHEIAETHGGLSREDAVKKIKNLQNSQRYIQELWA